MGHVQNIPAPEALRRLRAGNAAFVEAGGFAGDASVARRDRLAGGQAPFAIVICCADSRVVPEAIFGCGLGELFVIRVAGNVIGGHALGSAEYAIDHLGVRLAVVLGHTKCGAVGAAIAGETDGLVGMITRDIKDAIGDETDGRRAAILNAQAAAAMLRGSLGLADDGDVQVVSALYDVETGTVEWPCA